VRSSANNAIAAKPVMSVTLAIDRLCLFAAEQNSSIVLQMTC